jgi:hypothetical protein
MNANKQNIRGTHSTLSSSVIGETIREAERFLRLFTNKHASAFKGKYSNECIRRGRPRCRWCLGNLGMTAQHMCVNKRAKFIVMNTPAARRSGDPFLIVVVYRHGTNYMGNRLEWDRVSEY